MEKTTQSITKRCKLVVVDNTNVEYWEMKKYFKLASCHGYRVIIVEPKTSWKFNHRYFYLMHCCLKRLDCLKNRSLMPYFCYQPKTREAELFLLTIDFLEQKLEKVVLEGTN